MEQQNQLQIIALLTKTTYYKLKQVDYNGQFKYTVAKSITILAIGEIRIQPNPGNGIIRFQSHLNINATIKITVQNMLEQIVYSSTEEAIKGVFEKEIQLNSLASGMYLIHITAGEEQKVLKYIKE